MLVYTVTRCYENTVAPLTMYVKIRPAGGRGRGGGGEGGNTVPGSDTQTDFSPGWHIRVLPRGSTDGYPTRVFWVGWLSSTPTVFGWHPDTQTRDVGSGYSVSESQSESWDSRLIFFSPQHFDVF